MNITATSNEYIDMDDNNTYTYVVDFNDDSYKFYINGELKAISKEKTYTFKNLNEGEIYEFKAETTVNGGEVMNKGLELIEAVWLFDVSADMIDIVVHRESIVHSLIEYDDNSVIAQLGHPDMRLPIQFAITYPDRFESPEKQLDLWEVGNLSFYKPDYETFPCMDICRNAIKKGGLYPTAANGANEKAVELFLKGAISFNDIYKGIYGALSSYDGPMHAHLEDLVQADDYARKYVKEFFGV